MIMEEAGDVCGSKLNVSKTEDQLGCPLLVDGSYEFSVKHLNSGS